MKQFFLSVFLLTALVVKSFADEGMWLPMLLGQQVYNDMVKRGLKLTKEQLYSINKSSIKDAVVIFNGYCTAAVVSSDGLVFTNHHCGYEAIAAASSVEHNYLREGFYAKSKQEEIPTSMFVNFLLRIEDVTKEVTDSVGDLSGTDRAKKLSGVIAGINKRYYVPDSSIFGRVSALFKGNQYVVFVYQSYNDVRLAGAPAESIGKFGGDTDNFEWPRQTGDFSVFRIYTGKDGKPGQWSKDNIPYKPKYSLPISTKGYKEGDYAMTVGYPGGTNRYESSYRIKQMIDIDGASLAELLSMQMKYMMAEMKKDPAIRLQMANNYADMANEWKLFDGERKALIKYNIYDKRKAAEAIFQQWATDKPAYNHLFADWEKVYNAWRPISKQRIYYNTGILGSPLLAYAASLQQVEAAMVKQGSNTNDIKKAIEAADNARTEFLKNENKISDQNIVATTLLMFYTGIDKSQHPISFYENIKGSFGDLKEESTYKKFAADIFKSTMIFDSIKWKAFLANPDAVALQADPAFAVASAFSKNWTGKFLQQYQLFNAVNNDLGRLYIKGIMQMDTVKAKKMYPDATFTMRISYGNVKSYSPQDAVHYDYVTTMKSVLQKYVPGDYEFDLPANLLELAKKRDFGPYIDKVRNDLVVCFTTTNDIAGGNSGSPVLDANGNLIGLAFDSNYESLSGDIAYDINLNRCICVDIRYVLWCMDKLGGATGLVKELKMAK